MSLVNLLKTKQIKEEAFDQNEFNGLFNSAKVRLHDAGISTLALESRFDLAYNASHALALSALRYHGYRTDKRYVVFQALPLTLSIDSVDVRVLSKCHDKRNLAEYEGHLEVEEQLVEDLITICESLLKKVRALVVNN